MSDGVKLTDTRVVKETNSHQYVVRMEEIDTYDGLGIVRTEVNERTQIV